MLRYVESSPYSSFADDLWFASRDAERATWGLVALGPISAAAAFFGGPAAMLATSSAAWDVVSRQRRSMRSHDHVTHNSRWTPAGFQPFSAAKDLRNAWQDGMQVVDYTYDVDD